MDMPAHIAQQRREIGHTLKSLTAEQWATPSCCDGWSVLDTAAHLTFSWHYSTLRFNWDYVKAFGDLGKVNAKNIAELTKAGGLAIADDLQAHADYRFKPPGLGFAAPLNDLVIHRRDMFLPLGIAYETDPELVRLSLDKSIVGGMFGMVNARKKLNGLSFVATDLDWTHGDGPQVIGPGLALAHAMWGRAHSLPELDGPGVDTLADRLSA